jgi:hypothetical protein
MSQDYRVRKPFTLQFKEGDFTRVHKAGDVVTLTDLQLKKYAHMVEVYTEPEAVTKKTLKTEAV